MMITPLFKIKQLARSAWDNWAPSAPKKQPMFTPYTPPKGVADGRDMAMDAAPVTFTGVTHGTYPTFPGYPALAELLQLPEYRKMCNTYADEMTRKWVKLSNSDRVADVEKEMKRLQVRERFHEAALHDAAFGRSQIYVDTGTQRTEVPLTQVPKIKNLKCVEPVWTFPFKYNAAEPLKPDFFRPELWYVMNQPVHNTRLLTFIGREVPDLYKASYNFGGLSIIQMAIPYVTNWYTTRDAISRLLHTFSLSGLKTTLADLVSAGGNRLINRIKEFNEKRDNSGVLLIDKDTEEFFQFNVPLSGLDALQQQSQEQMSSVSNIPLVKFFGNTPSGLNASSDGEIRVFYDWIMAQQQHLFKDNLKIILDYIQLSLFGDVDESLEFEFVPLWEMDDADQAAINKTKADTDVALITNGVISPEDAFERLKNDPKSGYDNLGDYVEQEAEEELDTYTS